MQSTQKAFEAVIFDMDGTIFDSEILYYQAIHRALQEQGKGISEEAYYQHLAGRTNAIAIAHIRRQFGTTIDFQQYVARWPEILEELTEAPIPMMPTIASLLESLHQLNIPMAIGSSSDLEEIEHFTRNANIRHYFRGVAAGDEVEHGKPHPAIFQLAAKRLGVAAEKCIVLEDSNPGVEAGYRAGMQVVLGKSFITPNKLSLQRAIYTDDPKTATLELLGQASILP